MSASALTWLHLSDLHLSASRTYDANVVLKALVRDIAARINEDHLHPDFIAVTGDLALAGQADEYKLAREFLDQVLATTGLPRERLFVVPGNHDVDRKLITAGAKAIGSSLADRDSANAVLTTPDDRRLVLARFKGYAEFVNAYLGQGLDDEHYFYVRKLTVADQQVAVLGLNSAWLCGSDKDKAEGLLIGEWQARTALEQAGGAGCKIALLHHPFDWLREFDQNDSATMLTDGCDFILHGHLHRTAATQLTSPDGAAMILAGGACYETRDYPNMVNWVQLNLATGAGTVFLRRYSPERGGFWAKDTLTYKNVQDGVYAFALRGRAAATDRAPEIRTKPAPVWAAHSKPIQSVSREELVDFEDQLDFFRGMLDHSSEKRLMFVQAPGGCGKTSLLHMVRFHCEQKGVAWCWIDFQGQPYDNPHFTLARAMCDQVGLSPRQVAQASKPLSTYRPEGDVINSHVITQILTGVSLTHDGLRQRYMKECLSRAFVADLGDFAEEKGGVVCLFDSFEHISPEEEDWLLETLLRPVAKGELKGVIIVTAGRCWPNIEPREWHKWAHLEKSLPPMEVEHMKIYAEKVYTKISDERARFIWEASKGGNPQLMAMVVENLRAVREMGL